ncbi:MAG: metal-sulfur cluster assembly factor [Thermoprotei archaeon]
MDKEELKEKILDALKNVYDPEIPINIVDLGLVYDMYIDDKKNVKIKLGVTAPGCPLTGFLVETATATVKSNVPEVNDVEVEIAFDPPWTPYKMTKEGRELFKALYGYDIVEQYEQMYGIRDTNE